jgi:hypothetical protein
MGHKNFAMRLEEAQGRVERGLNFGPFAGNPSQEHPSGNSKVHRAKAVIVEKAGRRGRRILVFVTCCGNSETAFWTSTWGPVTCKRCLKAMGVH